jgi:hypothetical protein
MAKRRSGGKRSGGGVGVPTTGIPGRIIAPSKPGGGKRDDVKGGTTIQGPV